MEIKNIQYNQPNFGMIIKTPEVKYFQRYRLSKAASDYIDLKQVQTSKNPVPVMVRTVKDWLGIERLQVEVDNKKYTSGLFHSIVSTLKKGLNKAEAINNIKGDQICK